MLGVSHTSRKSSGDAILLHQAARSKTEEERQEFKKDLFSIQTKVKIERDFWFEI